MSAGALGRPLAVVALAAALVVAAGLSVSPLFAQERPADLTVSVSLTDVSVVTGETFTFTSEIANHGAQATPPLIASLNFVAVDHRTYVDPEDWSRERTVAVPSIPTGSSTTLRWTVNPVLAGEIAAFVAVLPEAPTLAVAAPLATSPAIHLIVEEHRALNPGGVLPVVIAVPVVLVIAFGGLRFSRRR